MNALPAIPTLLAASLLVSTPVPAAGTGDGVIPAPMGPGPAAAPSASATADLRPSPRPSPLLWLAGPFGRVPGGRLEAPAATPPDGRPLESWVRQAPLRLEVVTDRILVGLRVWAEPLSGDGPSEALSDGGLSFSGPDTPGTYLLVAETTDSSDTLDRQAWLVAVPDRERPPDGLYDIPAPEVILSTTAGQLAGEPGSGCYLYLCVEAGPAPPAEELGLLRAAAGEVPSVRLGDGSVITAWKGSLTSLAPDRPSRMIRAAGAASDTVEASVGLVGLEPRATGRWLLELEVELDRERGWLRTSWVLDVGNASEPGETSEPGTAG